MKHQAVRPVDAVAALIGDVVGSRESRDRQGLHDDLRAALRLADGATSPLQESWIMSGDEFQSVHSRIGQAVHAALLIRVHLHPVEVRFGIGWGEITVLDVDGVQDGPAWWSAREAISQVAVEQERAPTRALRTAYARPGGVEATGGADPLAVNAALVCRDQVLGSMDDRDLRILAGLLAGRTQRELAAEEKVSASAVSQRVSRSGIGMVLRAHELLRGL